MQLKRLNKLDEEIKRIQKRLKAHDLDQLNKSGGGEADM